MRTVALGDVCDVIMGQAPPGDTYNELGAGLPLIAGASDFGRISPTSSRFTTAATKLAFAGDIILCIRATIGDLNWADKTYCLGRGVAGVRAYPGKALPNFVWWILDANRNRLNSLGRGATFKQVNRDDIENLAVALPLLDEQRRIAAILDQANALRRRRREAVESLATLGSALFRHIFGDVVANDRKWRADVTLGELAAVASGITKGRKLNGAATRSVPYLAVANVQERRLDLTAVKSIDATEAEIQRYGLYKDDLLLTEGGDPDKLGRGTLWNGEIAECIHQNHVFRVRIGSDRLHPIFANWLIGSERGKRYFLQAAKQTTGIASINMSQLRAFPLLLPPVEVQERFAAELASVESMRSAAIAHLAHLDTLFASLQHRAFRGEL